MYTFSYLHLIYWMLISKEALNLRNHKDYLCNMWIYFTKDVFISSKMFFFRFGIGHFIHIYASGIHLWVDKFWDEHYVVEMMIIINIVVVVLLAMFILSKTCKFLPESVDALNLLHCCKMFHFINQRMDWLFFWKFLYRTGNIEECLRQCRTVNKNLFTYRETIFKRNKVLWSMDLSFKQ